MDVMRPDQIIALVAFMGVLGLLWLAVQRHKGGLAGRLHGNRRLRVAETAALGGADRAMILRVDEREFLLLRLKGAAPLLHPLGGGGARAATEAGAPADETPAVIGPEGGA